MGAGEDERVVGVRREAPRVLSLGDHHYVMSRETPHSPWIFTMGMSKTNSQELAHFQRSRGAQAIIGYGYPMDLIRRIS